MTMAWGEVARRLREVADTHDDARLDAGQRASLRWIARRIGTGGLVLADEVGTGKTRIACAVVHAVLEAGGRAAVVVPRGVMHQWASESRALDEHASRPKRLTSFGDSIREASESGGWDDFSPKRTPPEWWLISHGFCAPRVSAKSRPWRIALPSLVAHALAPEEVREDGRTRLGSFHASLKTQRQAHWGLPAMHRVASDVSKTVRRGSGLHQRIAALPLVDLDGDDNAALIDLFGPGEQGRALTEELLGRWLGAFDLVVIDEAHKSRGEDDDGGRTERDASKKVLARLLDHILVQPADGRRICLTATPMELNVAQWFDLLARAGCTLDESAKERVSALPMAAAKAQAAPDEQRPLEELRAAASGFTDALSPYVTRRRRLDDGFVRTFCERLPPERRVLAHPHRNIAAVPVAWPSSGPGAAWSEVLFAAECMSRAALGLTREETEGWPESLRRTFSSLASGHLTADVLDAGERIERAATATDDGVRAAKIERVAHWHGVMQRARRNAAKEGGDPDHAHPRIAAAVKEIERWTAMGEKVLVFGVFLAPMRRLRDVLNARHALRAVDAGRPLAHDPLDGDALEALVRRQWALLHEESGLQGVLATAPDGALRGHFKQAHARYEKARKQVRRDAGRTVAAWCQRASHLGGEAPDDGATGLLVDHLVGFVVDHQLRVDARDERAVDALAEAFFTERLQPLFGEDDEDDDAAVEPTDRWEKVRRALSGDSQGELGQQSAHARLLSGAMQREETRRYLQAAFNRKGADPHVLMAQSRVGREGLNLHGACRVVVQFHAEWNPAVLEQQIGRVDRKGGLWEELAREWISKSAREEAPLIEVRRLVFEGTYDAFQWDRVSGRQRDFDASLFGALLPEDSWERVPEAWREKLKSAAPSFAPQVDSARGRAVEPRRKRR